LNTAETSQECLSAAGDLGEIVKEHGLIVLETQGIVQSLMTSATNKKSGLEREGGYLGIAGIIEKIGKPCEPYFLPLLSQLVEGYADKGQPVREAADLAVSNLLALCDPIGVPLVLPYLYECLGGKWQAKVSVLKHIAALAQKAPTEVGLILPDLIPVVTDCMHDTKKDVSVAAVECMTKICGIVGNPDIEPHIGLLVDCMAHPDHVATTVQKISSTTFVAEVTGPALSIMVPLLVRALSDRSAQVVRASVIIADNLFKLVRIPADAGQFMPQILPSLDRIIETAAFPEVRALANAAKNTLVKAASGSENQLKKISDPDAVYNKITEFLGQLKIFLVAFYETTYYHVALMIGELVKEDIYGRELWAKLMLPYFDSVISKADAQKLFDLIYDYYYEQFLATQKDTADDNDDDGEVLCDTLFSLAYGGMMLLNHTRLRLRRGQRYGLCGHNGAGKSTLMRAISLGKVEGFPPQDELKTVFVEHSLQGEDGSLSVLDFLASDKRLSDTPKTSIAKTLEEVGFDDYRRSQPVGSLSGGWKMKLELARAMLLKADILLLDEPTNHLDVENVKWLEDYLISQKNITSVIVSHDSTFLDNVCTYIIHYETKKLVYYKGNLSKFVEKRPEAKSYYTLAATSVKFSFPPPSILLGVRSNTKAILKMNNCTFTYPGASRPSLRDATAAISLSSRVGIVGPNGAGKSTMVKLLTGELIPQTGVVWKHPNIRIGYVAQHAFHHLEQHLEKTPNEYIQWRYQGGQDREVLEKATRKFTDEDLQQMETPVIGANGEKRKIEMIMGRQKLKKSFQYEIKWVGFPHRFNKWMSRDELLDLGFHKLVQAFDDQEASREGQATRELAPSIIRKHLEDVGLPGEIADHNAISGLSGGQKVKVVLAAAMWNQPHMLVLDEPTNYLDREALGGLAVAIRSWSGAVIMISHHTEFVQALCPELWHVDNGEITKKGESAVKEDNFED
ncbi:P-loop containing nucleoside triphosphate hydrolase protein, partial [Gorgonomyces haynaldii]